MAVSTCEGSTAPDEQAAPVEQARPFRSRAMIRASPSMPGKVMLVVLGVRGAWRRWHAHRNASEQAVFEFVAQRGNARVSLMPESSRASSAALPRPTIPGTFSVPGRNPRW